MSRRQTVRSGLALSARETEVLEFLHSGLSIPAIAARMYISPSTAKTYVSRLYEKLGAANRAQALMIALRHGLIQFDRDLPAPLVVRPATDPVAAAIA